MNADANQLTARERELMRTMTSADDTSDKSLARLLGISTKTVDAHLKNIRHKFHVHTRTAALRRWLQITAVFMAMAAIAQTPAKLVVEQRGSDVVLYVTGGTSNVQYQVWTPADNKLAGDQWYYWRRIYSRDFLSNHGYGEVLIYGENTSKQPMRFFQIRGVLPD